MKWLDVVLVIENFIKENKTHITFVFMPSFHEGHFLKRSDFTMNIKAQQLGNSPENCGMLDLSFNFG